MSKKRKSIAVRPGTRKDATSIRKSTALRSDLLIALLLGLFGFVLYANTLGHGYVMDDDLAISINPNVVRGIAGIPDLFTQPYRENCFGGCLYRPLTLATFAVEWSLAPKSPYIGHLMNVLWYAATAALLFLTLRRLMPSTHLVLSLIAVIWFTAHPVHTEVVANIKSRDEILSLFFIILSFHQYAKWQVTNNWKTLLVAGLAFFAALLSKEGVITAMILFPLVGWIFFQKSFLGSLKNSLWVVVPVGLFFLLRGSALSGLTEPEISMMDNPIVDAQGTQLIGTSLLILAKYLSLLALPLQLISDYTYNVIPLQSFGSIPGLVGLILYSSIGGFSLYALIKRNKAGFFGLAFLSAIALYSQVPKVIGTIMGERLLYTPSLWFILGIVSLFAALFKNDDGSSSSFQWKRLGPVHRGLLVAFAGLALFFCYKTIDRNRDWANNLALYTADVAKAPNSVRLNDGFAEETYKSTFDPSLTAGDIEKRLIVSEEYSRKSLVLKPGISAYNNLGNVHFTRRKFTEAISYYQQCLEIIPNYKTAKQNIVYVYLIWARQEGEKNNNPTRARELLREALTYDADNSEVWHLIGVSYGVQGNDEEAMKAFEIAYSIDPAKPEVIRDLKRVYLSLGLTEKAEALE